MAQGIQDDKAEISKRRSADELCKIEQGFVMG